MFRWPDCVAVIGILLAAIFGGWLGVLPTKLVTALVMAVVGYVAAMRLLSKREEKKKPPGDGGVVESRGDVHESGRIEIRPQQPGRIVEVSSDGSVHIGPVPGTECAPDDDTPTDGVPPVDEPEEGTKP